MKFRYASLNGNRILYLPNRTSITRGSKKITPVNVYNYERQKLISRPRVMFQVIVRLPGELISCQIFLWCLDVYVIKKSFMKL